MNQKGFVGILVLIVLIIVGVGAGAYYFGKVSNKAEVQQTNNTSITSSPSQNAEAPSNSPEAVTLIEKSVQLKISTAVSGDESINVTFQIPSTWTLQTVVKASNPSDLIKNCSDIVISSPSSTKLVVSAICTGWAATYSEWPQDAVQIKVQEHFGDSGYTNYTIRYFNKISNQYIYANGEKGSGSNKIQDAVIVDYSDGFIPTHITLTSSSDSDIKLADQIISSLKASVQ